MNIDGDDATPGLPPKGALEEAVALFDELRALVAQEEIRIPHMAADCNREHTKIADLDSRRAALEPRLAKRRENQAKPRGDKP